MNSHNKKGKVREVIAVLAALLVIGGTIPSHVMADETATLTVKSIPNVSIRMYGFMENDVINDAKQISSLEELDNPLVPKASTWAGQNGRTIDSVRNSRLGFDVTMPETDFGLKSEAIVELDALGDNAETQTAGANTAVGTSLSGSTLKTSNIGTPGSMSERDLFNNPTIRIRHAYGNFTDGQWNFKVGQTWSLLGWQPHYFPAEPNVAPTVGMLYRRFPQIRATNTQKLGDSWTLETALDFAKPAEMNGQSPEYHAGIRLASTKTTAGVWAGSGSSMEGLSLAASGAIIPIRTGDGSPTGSAIALDAFIPIIPSSDGKNASNTLSLLGEYCNGTGIGGLEIAGLTGGLSTITSVTAAAAQANGLTPQTAIDSGMAAISATGAVELLHVQTYRASLQYIFPSPKWSINGGFADESILNLADFTASTSLSPRDQYFFGNILYQPLKWLKFGLEVAQIKTTYTDAANTYAYDNRSQFTTYVMF
jgi:hypothetical protein